jgi:N-acetylneuraminic acid mutarotase
MISGGAIVITNQKILYLLTIPILFLMFSCSEVPGSVIPADNDLTGISNVPLLVSEYDSSGRALAGQGLLGLFSLRLETDPLLVELTPLRTANLTDSLEFMDITNYLTLVPCKRCVNIKSVGLDSSGRIMMTIGIKHPFAAGNPTLPISGQNRIDLHVYNVEGILALVGGTQGTMQFTASQITVARGGIINPSGYTSYLDEYLDNVVPTPANAHPYILHFRDYTMGNYLPGFNPTGYLDVFAPTGNLVMPQGSDYDYRDYVLNVESGHSYDFLYAVQCCYGVSTESFLDRFDPEYRLPQYNKKAASEVFVSVKENAMIGGSVTGTAVISVQVLDMNHGIEVGIALNKMSNDSSIKQITLELPDLMTTPILDTTLTAVGGDPRDPANPLTFEYTVTNENGIPEGRYLGLVGVEDNFPLNTNTHPYIMGREGGIRVPPGYSALTGLIDIDKYITYQVFEYDVLPALEFHLAALMPVARTYARATVVGDKIYVIGGTLGFNPTDPRSNAIHAYDPLSDTWDITLSPMPTSRAGMGVAAVGDEIYVIGGQLVMGSGNTNVVEVYNTISNSWATFPTVLPGPKRHGMGCVAKDHIIYVAGGYNTVDKEQSTMYRLDTVLQSWGAEPSMIAKRTQFAMTVKGDFIYVVGGDPVVGTGSNLTPYVEVYDTVNRLWSYPTSSASIEDIAPDPYTGILGPAWENVNGDIIFVGGAYDTDLLNDKAYLYDEIAGEFLEVGSVILPRTLFASAAWQNRIYMFGGIALSGDPPVPFMTSNTEYGEW